MMHDEGKSDDAVVPAKLSNERAIALEEGVEGRASTKGNAEQQTTSRTQSRSHDVSHALNRVREAARQDRNAKFTALLHHVTVGRLQAAFRAIRRGAAAGVDGLTWAQYAEHEEENLRALHARIHRGGYRAKASRRVFIPKSDGRLRPLGIAALEDKIVQGALAEVMNAIYEVDFLGFSYGFRQGRGQHTALDALATAITRRRVNWVLEVDIRGFFDAIDHGWLQRMLEHRIADRRVLRLIQKWLKAGVIYEGVVESGDAGSPQGATISPLLANIYLHYAFDLWARQWRSRRCRGDMVVVRYADDIVVGFEHEETARAFLHEVTERLRKFALDVHLDKTKLLRFGRFAARDRRQRGESAPETFDFLGFTHICGQARGGYFVLVRHTSKTRMRATLHRVRRALLMRRHLPIPRQAKWLRHVVQGYFAYHAIPTNSTALEVFRREVLRAWLRALRRRGQRDRMNWAKLNRLADRWIPRGRILHPWPTKRFDAMTQGRSPVR